MAWRHCRPSIPQSFGFHFDSFHQDLIKIPSFELDCFDFERRFDWPLGWRGATVELLNQFSLTVIGGGVVTSRPVDLSSEK